MRSCQHMLAMRHAPEAATRRSLLRDLVVQLSLLIAAFRPDALRGHSRVERKCMSKATHAQSQMTQGIGDSSQHATLELDADNMVRMGLIRAQHAGMNAHRPSRRPQWLNG